MSHWNHRVVRRTFDNGTTLLGIHEAFCDKNGLVWAITTDPVSPMVEPPEEGLDELKKVLGWMLKACDQPVLDFDSIPEEGAKSPDWTEGLGEDDD